MRFQGGSNGGGRPAGSRNRLQTKFLTALADDFEKHGADAIKLARIEDPIRYVSIIAGLLPREFAVTENHLGDLSDEEVHALLARIRETLNVIDLEPEKAAALLPMRITDEQEGNGGGIKEGRGPGRARGQAPGRGE
jgi:hypothetical protein